MTKRIATWLLAAALAIGLAFPAGAHAQMAARTEKKEKKREPIPLDPTPDCAARISGAFQASFKCKVDARAADGSGLRLSFMPQKLPDKVGAFLCGPVKIASPAKAKRYSGAELQEARILVSGPKHGSYAAEAGKVQRGDIAVRLKKVEVAPHASPNVKGILTAHLVGASGDPKDEIVLTVKF